MRTWSLRLLRQLFRLALSALHMLPTAASAAFKSRATVHLENLALRHQLSVLRRSVKRPKLTSAARLLWAWLCEAWIDWRSSLVIVKPETVIGWHRKGFQLFWTWKVRHGQPGRPAVSKEIRQLIRKMSRENPLWGAPRIHGELLKLGLDSPAGMRRPPPAPDEICGRHSRVSSRRSMRVAISIASSPVVCSDILMNTIRYSGLVFTAVLLTLFARTLPQGAEKHPSTRRVLV